MNILLGIIYQRFSDLYFNDEIKGNKIVLIFLNSNIFNR